MNDQLRSRTTSHLSASAEDLIIELLKPKRFHLGMNSEDIGYETAKADLKDNLERLLGYKLDNPSA